MIGIAPAFDQNRVYVERAEKFDSELVMFF
jgi:hypothetical protein